MHRVCAQYQHRIMEQAAGAITHQSIATVPEQEKYGIRSGRVVIQSRLITQHERVGGKTKNANEERGYGQKVTTGLWSGQQRESAHAPTGDVTEARGQA